ncbi:hypothetical protein [Acidocella sp.]|jgi:uncharacterized protein (DUF697 family)|uniref:hypothetical protein n=1 Tax=Acidocella sp. TaxID=50710 RepID=UPI002F3E735B
MATKAEKIHALIHAAAASCAAVGGGLAQAPGTDTAVITPIQVAMIVAIGAEHCTSIGKTAAAELILPFSAAALGRGLSQCLLGWIPGLGNAINAVTAAALTEAIGWAANAYFAEQAASGRVLSAGRHHE